MPSFIKIRVSDKSEALELYRAWGSERKIMTSSVEGPPEAEFVSIAFAPEFWPVLRKNGIPFKE